MEEKKVPELSQRELLNQYEKMKKMALRDALTGLLNRGALEKEIRRRLSRMEGADICALLIIDLDNFKAVNDTFGHQTGDDVLVKTARLLSGMFRATDIVGRLGGDEFVVFLCGCLSREMIRSKGQLICERLQIEVGEEKKIKVTASVGIHVSEGGETFEIIYRSADSALYKAKREGKRTYCIRTNAEEEEGEAYRTPVNLLRHQSIMDCRIMGVIEGMVYGQKERKHQPKGVSLPKSLMSSLVLQMSGNLSEDTVENCWIEGRDVMGEHAFTTCTEVLTSEIQHAFIPESGEKLFSLMSRDALMLKFLEQDTQWMTYEYRRVDQSGNIGWVSCVINLYQEEEENDIHIALWLSSLEQRYHWETKFGISLYKDPVTKLYAQYTIREIAIHLLEERKHRLCALVMIEIDGMAKLYKQDSGNIDMRRKSVVMSLLLAVGTGCIPGQVGTDRYLIFFPDIESENVLKQNLEQAFLFVRSVTSDLIDGEMIRFAAAGITRYQDETEYSTMLKKVNTLSQLWNLSSGDTVIFVDEKREDAVQLERRDAEDNIRVLQEGLTRPLSGREKDAALSCVLEMLNAESPEQSADCMLRTLGEYYDADRVYVLVPAEHGYIITMPYEWTSGHKHSIRQVVSGMLIEKFPLLERCKKEERPVFLTRHTSGDEDVGQDGETWRFAVFPMRDSGKANAYLCIENSRNHIADATLPALLSSCFLKERKKSVQKTGRLNMDGGDGGAELPNQSSYMEAIYRFTSDTYSSLGAVSVDIPEFSHINSRKGFEYGRKMLWYIIQMLADTFGRARLYRTWDAEFVALCPNTTQQVFYGKCARLRTALMRKYPKEVRIGYTWADKVFNGKKLVEEAKEVMRFHSPVKGQVNDGQLPEALTSFSSVGEMISAGRFTVYYQPEIDLDTGMAIGAEALVRGIGEDGSLISPDQFIAALEKRGEIRDLDLFVLDCVMKQLEKWKEEGWENVQVSINFSRATLFDSHIKASLLAIRSRYPSLDSSCIGLEITESTCDMSRQVLIRAMDSLREYGFSFSLDNLGTKYPNLPVFADIPFETIKIDRSLISDMIDNESSRMLIKDIVDTCSRKKICCVAGGVETPEQISVLKKAGCRYVQGYYYDRPLTGEAFAERYLTTDIRPA